MFRHADASCGLNPTRRHPMHPSPSTNGQRPWQPTVKENPRRVLCGSPWAEPAILVARQLPTHHDHDGECSHSIHEYQSDQPSRIAATAAAHWCSMIGKCRRRRRRHTATLDGSLHIRTGVPASGSWVRIPRSPPIKAESTSKSHCSASQRPSDFESVCPQSTRPPSARFGALVRADDRSGDCLANPLARGLANRRRTNWSKKALAEVCRETHRLARAAAQNATDKRGE